MGHKFPKTHQQSIFKYLLLHDGETILQKNISRDTGVGLKTIRRDLKYFEKRGIIHRDGKDISVLDYG